jgi:YidC/Oxa1 family membrane protein insertase
VTEQRNLLLALILSALVLLGWTLISDRYFPTANKPATKVVDGKQVPLPDPSASRSPPRPSPRAPASRCWPPPRA